MYVSSGPSHCHHHSYTDDFPSYKRHGSARNRAFDGSASANLSVLSSRCKIPCFGSAFHVATGGHDLGLTKVSVAADYSDSVPDSSFYGYHPMEDLKPGKRVQETKLSPAEVARTTVEANSSAVLVFPGAIHCEPHDHNSWSEFKYVIDDYGDIFFDIPDDVNILEDPGASNPVKAFFGMDVPRYENSRLHEEYNISDIGNLDQIIFDDHYFEMMDSEAGDIPVDWGMPDTSNGVHPIYFAKHMSKATSMDYDRKMDYPSNGVSILACLRPAFLDEESYIRRLFLSEDRDDYSWEVQGDDNQNTSSRHDDENDMSSSLYRLEIVGIELLSLYGTESSVSLQDFQDAEPDILVHSTSAIIERFNNRGVSSDIALKALCKKKGLHAERFNNRGVSSDIALKALCKKKGLHAEEANLISVDSLGMDVRVFAGAQVQTHRFPFKTRATTEMAAEKKMHQLLFPRSRRRKLKSNDESLKDAYR
ncbi:hypothetical protein F2Q69_00062151 [Brassica cretica]|uniref:DUF2470 domain-containing protein n=1 Tax=Brassica cretica TaxID=69181 RepID=A0A8S9RGL2_BRACR|nr:hypothetical protein F2Q69_00062151 [Brassica cretica]